MPDDLEESSLPGRPGFFVQTVLTGLLLMVTASAWTLHGAASWDNAFQALFLFAYGGILSVITISIVSVAGLPLRVIRGVRTWWVARRWIALAGIAVGLVLVVLSAVRSSDETYTRDGYEYYLEQGNYPLAVVGWFILAFFAMHSWSPERGSGARQAATAEANR